MFFVKKLRINVFFYLNTPLYGNLYIDKKIGTLNENINLKLNKN